MSLERQDIDQLKKALHAAEGDNISFGLATTEIALENGQRVNAEEWVKTQIKTAQRSSIAAPIISVLERHGWNGEY